MFILERGSIQLGQVHVPHLNNLHDIKPIAHEDYSEENRHPFLVHRETFHSATTA